MNWSNWTTYMNSVVDFFFSLFPRIWDLIFSSPLLGVPVLLMIISMVFGVVVKFIGALRSDKKED